ncbi:MAG: 23S rRNA (uracil(1939)-C(5))-methyltransferase RlmD [Candidatus Goldiibacteriota bacterium HGW-Goldbacteria-1]|jgi:23S rRNA (uracil1939-C5)-methyltransferase|nr:MAG: 23S rRNA (uracil(1939)-C(5))-methyltransferase RlmD [Candidatus Goldiibacteriota bacterium HGW-Goldbacteria-1]
MIKKDRRPKKHLQAKHGNNRQPSARPAQPSGTSAARRDITVTIDGFAYGGDGIARFENSTVYIPYALPGSTITARITEEKNKVIQARMVSVVKPSPFYTKPECPYFGECGGCDFMNMPYETQANFKIDIIQAIMEETAAIKSPPMKPLIRYEVPLHYRNRAEYRPAVIGSKISLGFYRARSHEVIGIKECLLLHPKINLLAKIITDSINENPHSASIYSPSKHKGYLRHVTIRINSRGDALITFVVNGKEPKQFILRAAQALQAQPGIAGILINFNMEETNDVFGSREKILYGRPSIIETAAGISFKLNNSAFFQVNAVMMEKMAEFVGKKIPDRASVLDLYGGVGALTLPSHKKFRDITVIEADRNAAQNLREIIKWNKISHVNIITSKVEDTIDRVLEDKSFDAAVIDPPRSGMHPRVISAIKAAKIGTLIYISCNPSSFARDIADLKSHYHLDEMTPLDQFAQTYHTEIMARLSII